ncbi:hypothetical protein ACFCYB_42970, partial [Streptomyces sp. NPDC056309]
GAATIKPSRKPVTSGDTFSRTSHDRNYSCGVIASSAAVVEAARNAFEAASQLHNASSKTELRGNGNEAKEILERFISLASNDVR